MKAQERGRAEGQDDESNKPARRQAGRLLSGSARCRAHVAAHAWHGERRAP